MAFPNGWGRKCELQIQASKVLENLIDFPVFLTKDTLPSEMFDSDGSYPALAGGGDIRFSSDVAGATRLACEVVRFEIDPDPVNGIAEIWVNVPSVSSSVDTSIWVWYNKAGEDQPGVSETYGREATWNSSYLDVWHLDKPGKRYDSTGRSHFNWLMGNNPSQVVGKVGRAANFDGDSYMFDPTPADPGIGFEGAFCFSIWLRTDPGSLSNDGILAMDESRYLPAFRIQFVDPYMCPGIWWGQALNPSAPDRSIGDDQWHLAYYTRTGSTITVYVDNGNSQGTMTKDRAIAVPAQFWLGTTYGGWDWFGDLDEMRLCNVARSSNFIISEYNNQNDPATFVIEQTPEGPGGSLYKLEGITKNKDGNVLVSCKCFLFKDKIDNYLHYKDYVISDAVTGAYSFTGISDNDTEFIVVAWKDDTPHVFDMSDHVLQPVAE